MKKQHLGLVSLSVAALLMVGCGEEEEQKAPEAAKPPVETVKPAEPSQTEKAKAAVEEASQSVKEAAVAVATEVQEKAIQVKESATEAGASVVEKTANKVTEMATAVTEATGGKSIDGQAVYQGLCFSCHDMGLAGAPKLGDKAMWADRIATGKEALYGSALNGKGAMPAKGGNPGLSDEEIKAAVDYMASKAQ